MVQIEVENSEIFSFVILFSSDTVWNFQDFSVNQILRKINFR